METTNNDRAIMELIIRLFQFELECSEEKYVKLALQTAKKNDSYDGRRGAIS